MESKFVWVDLSTFNVGQASRFYSKVFGWDWSDSSAGYLLGSIAGEPNSGLYEMPDFFQKIRMPSFWMTYISVDDIQQVAKKARALGGRVEIEEDSERGKIALIRDPAGADFTCYEGKELSSCHAPEISGHWSASQLMVSKLETVQPFYESLFKWHFVQDTDGRYFIKTASEHPIGSVLVADNSIKGDKEFWAVYFSVPNIQKAMDRIEEAGGQSGGLFRINHERLALAYDDQGAAFFLQENKGTSEEDSPSSPPESRKANNLKWRSILGLISIYLIILTGQNWIWGVFFLIWVLPDLKRGITYFIEPVNRRKEPVLYWAIVFTWLALAVLMLLGIEG